MALWPIAASGHPIYTDHIEHRARVIVDSVNIDIELELTFNELRSLAERRRMDADRDGRLSPLETKAYLGRVTRGLEEQLRITVGGEPIEVITLYEPQLDLLGADGIEPRHHVLRLFYFARMPATLAAGDEIALEDRLWDRAPALWSFQAEGQKGVAVGPTDAFGLDVPATSPEGREPLRGRCRIDEVPARPAPAVASVEPPEPLDAAQATAEGRWVFLGIGLAALLAMAGGGTIYWLGRHRGAFSCHRQ